MKKNFYSNGKLLLTGEYVVLDGATGFAIPTSYGQNLEVNPISDSEIRWTSLDDEGKTWFSEVYTLQTLQSTKTADSTSKMLSNILIESRQMNPKFLSEKTGYEITTRLDFPMNWGLGSSSTLINNISQWAQVNPFRLLEKTFGGSGYDIAAAQNKLPILYSKTNKDIQITPVSINWNFTDRLFFIHLNKKQNSRSGIAHYQKLKPEQSVIERISEISQELYKVSDLKEFELLLEEHEQIISKLIKLPTVHSELFSDYASGTVKSLGAWGGDFILATGKKEKMKYFKEKGFGILISFNDMIFSNH